MKKFIKKLLVFLVFFNSGSFLILAYFHRLSTTPSAAVFIDFWGRFTVYSLWFIGFTFYGKYLPSIFQKIVFTIVCLNIPFFLILAYFEKISNDPENLVFIDFWGRITVYSLWFICYELYRKYLESEKILT